MTGTESDDLSVGSAGRKQRLDPASDLRRTLVRIHGQNIDRRSVPNQFQCGTAGGREQVRKRPSPDPFRCDRGGRQRRPRRRSTADSEQPPGSVGRRRPTRSESIPSRYQHPPGQQRPDQVRLRPERPRGRGHDNGSRNHSFQCFAFSQCPVDLLCAHPQIHQQRSSVLAQERWSRLRPGRLSVDLNR